MAKIAIVGEAWGAEEEKLGHPFVGAAGRELIALMREAGLFSITVPKVWAPQEVRHFWLCQPDVTLHNVFNLRPEGNDITKLCAPRKEVSHKLPALQQGKYIRDEYLGELPRLYDELSKVQPNLVVALGNTASWALLHNTGISKIRGAVTSSINGLKVLPTYHPAAILRQWELRHVTILDLIKARREREFPEIRRPERTVYVDPSIPDLHWFHEEHIRPCRRLAFDIETSGHQITCVGFAPSPAVALVVPFVDRRKSSGSYWGSAEEELAAWSFVREVLGSGIPKVAQNGLFDITFLWRVMGIRVVNFEHDTMLLHHALQPESPKGLGFLGSVYTSEAAWKLMNRKTETLKRDE